MSPHMALDLEVQGTKFSGYDTYTVLQVCSSSTCKGPGCLSIKVVRES